MKKFALLFILILSSCVSLTRQEQNKLAELRSYGITVDTPADDWKAPASPAAAAALNLLPGFGDFYLASGEAGDSSFYLYGFLNLLTWPISVLWGIPEGAIDANTINKRELIYFYTYDTAAKETLNRLELERKKL